MSDIVETMAAKLASMPGVGKVSVEMQNGTVGEIGLHTLIADLERRCLTVATLINSAQQNDCPQSKGALLDSAVEIAMGGWTDDSDADDDYEDLIPTPPPIEGA